jgi:hypothetical protein
VQTSVIISQQITSIPITITDPAQTLTVGGGSGGPGGQVSKSYEPSRFHMLYLSAIHSDNRRRWLWRCDHYRRAVEHPVTFFVLFNKYAFLAEKGASNTRGQALRPQLQRRDEE